jgi:glucokinase
VSAPEAIGVDVGGTKIAVLRVAAEGDVVARATRRTPAEDEAATLAVLDEAVEEVRVDAVVAIGVGAAGLVDVARGTLLSSPNLSWRDVPLRERLRSSFGLPVTVDNDATAGAWGEYRLGASRSVPHSLFVGVGTGIGGGIVQDGRLVRGASGFAGEIGHVIVEPDGPPCGCGNRGCWEQVASGHAIARAGRAAIAARPDSAIAALAGGDPGAVTGAMVTEAALAGDETAVAILQEVGRRLGEGVAGLVNVLDPSIVVMGGGAAMAGELLLGPLRAAYRATVEGVDVRPEVPIVPASLGNDAGAVGAALLALDAVG